MTTTNTEHYESIHTLASTTNIQSISTTWQGYTVQRDIMVYPNCVEVGAVGAV